VREELASTTTAHRLLQERAAASAAATAGAHEQVDKLLAEKAAVHEELGTLKVWCVARGACSCLCSYRRTATLHPK
jgi:hypothetical protein